MGASMDAVYGWRLPAESGAMHGLSLKLWRCPGADLTSLRLELVMCKSGELRTTPKVLWTTTLAVVVLRYRRVFPDTW